jgi:hypothetical protein
VAFFLLFHHDCRANNVSSQDGWRLQVMFEVLRCLVCLLSPLGLVMVLVQLEEG